MDRTAFGSKMRARVADRFVPARSLLEPSLSHYKLLSQRNKPAATVFDEPISKFPNMKKYTRYLDHAFNLPGPSTRMLNFNPNQKKAIYTAASTGSKVFSEYPELQTWPCRPRKRPYIGSADSVLDLPNYGSAACNFELVDWSRNNLLLAALDNNIYIWSWEKQSLVCRALTTSIANCSKFNPHFPDTIAVALDSGGVETFKVEIAKYKSRKYYRCDCFDGVSRCSVTALDWSPTGRVLVIGCSCGCLTVLDESLCCVTRRPYAHATTVLRLRVSPDTRFLASLALYESTVSIWQWPHLKPYFIFENYSMVKSMAWHPWQSSMLAIGASSSKDDSCAVLAVWDVAPARLRQPTVVSSRRIVVDYMLFSHVTGEMVLCCWMDNVMMNPQTRRSEPGSRIMVLSDPSTEVDRWTMGDHVNTMMFSPDGTKLAIATADEDLVILYYLPEEPEWKKTNHNRKSHCALAAYLDAAETGVCKR